ncbi:MAG: hypothetical protein ACI86L_001617 [Dokdonia sp.]|jgi:hypothetical protein
MKATKLMPILAILLMAVLSSYNSDTESLEDAIENLI